MRKNIQLFILALIVSAFFVNTQAQNTYPGSGAVGIGTLSPASSSLLDITSTTKGVLIPRMTKTQRDAIASPATGLLIYQTNSTAGFYYYTGTVWTAVSAKGANTSLSNLVAAGTAVNANLNPSATGIRDIGSATLRWDEIYGRSVDGQNSSADVATGTFVNQYAVGDADQVAVLAVADTLFADLWGIGVLSSGGYIGNYGIGYLGSAGVGDAAGVYGEAIDTVAGWAGYFFGDIGYTGSTFDVSDRKFKTNIHPIAGSLDKLMQLKPAAYTFNNEAETVSLRLSGKSEMGLIADELEQVFPELVKDAVIPMRRDPKTGEQIDEIAYKGVNYTGLIPVLISSVQEQQKLIEEKDATIASLTERLDRLEAAFATASTDAKNIAGSNYTSTASLDQNSPNPFKDKTVISYNLPESSRNAVIKVYAMNGAEMKTVSLNGTGKGNIEIGAGSFAPGTYTYQLIIDGKSIDTKLMVITE